MGNFLVLLNLHAVAIGKKLQTNEKIKRSLINSNRNFNETSKPRSALT